ncbi:probable WRKY transcription factor 14 [Arachis stenosperma]|uniref:probable WRKY transcription factor 14 n=1 Tax=Arachis stenosperma TaxID=217475 RepID=UPI0025AC8D2F|nr:probable WRKY transcription factor 14 [Arachis stenosperma]
MLVDPLKTPLNWRTRLQIANEVVVALEYLFLFSDLPAYHVSISSGNIMLDENFAAKLLDFGFLTPSANSVMMANSGGPYLLTEYKTEVLILSYFTKHLLFRYQINYDCTELKNLLAVAKLCIKSRDKATFTISQLFRRNESRSNEAAVLEEALIEPRIMLQSSTNSEIIGDGFRWRKYGQKVVKGNPYPQSYYRCTNVKCNVQKHVEREIDDPRAFVTTYEGKHNHEMPTKNINPNVPSERDSQASLSKDKP